jgi:arylsulfatase A-like enzyme
MPQDPRMLSRRTFLAAAGAAAATISGRGVSPAEETPLRRPNILYVFSDEHRYQSMSFTEMPALQTPVMARMAREGFSFNQSISNYPVCSPYRGMLMTGRWPYQTGVIDNGIPLQHSEYALGHAFQAAGYRTGYIGKWHLGGTRAEPFGFDLSLIWTETNTYYDTSRYHPKEGEPVRPKGYNATLMTDQALEFMNASWDTPFLLVLSLNPPHADFTGAPPEKRALYPEGSLPYRPNVRDNVDTQVDIARHNRYPHYEGYHAHISAVDDELGRILAAVAASPKARETIVIYTSDHGSMFGSHGVGSKRQPFEESIRTPFLLHAPGMVKPGATDALFGAVDVMPTLCGLAGIPAPPSCSGRDYSGHVFGKGGPEPDAQLIMHIAKDNASGGQKHPAPIFRGVRAARHTYFVLEDGSRYLFDNIADPYQLENRADDPACAGIRDRLHARLIELLREAEDPIVLPPVA